MKYNAQVAATTYPYTSGTTGTTGACNTNLLSPGVIKVGLYDHVGKTNGDIQSNIVLEPTAIIIDGSSTIF